MTGSIPSSSNYATRFSGARRPDASKDDFPAHLFDRRRIMSATMHRRKGAGSVPGAWWRRKRASDRSRDHRRASAGFAVVVGTARGRGAMDGEDDCRRRQTTSKGLNTRVPFDFRDLGRLSPRPSPSPVPSSIAPLTLGLPAENWERLRMILSTSGAPRPLIGALSGIRSARREPQAAF